MTEETLILRSELTEQTRTGVQSGAFSQNDLLSQLHRHFDRQDSFDAISSDATYDLPPIRDLQSIPKETEPAISSQPKSWKIQKPPNFAPNRTTSLIKNEQKQEQDTTET